MNHLSEVEIQTLIGLIELNDPITTPNNNGYVFYPKTIQDAQKYFRRFALDWHESYNLLEKHGYVFKSGDTYFLTALGIEVANKLRKERPPIFYWYKEYYLVVKDSKAYAEYCSRLFGRNLSQDGFSDMEQLHFLLNQLNANNQFKILDLGCGNGKIAEFVADVTDGFVFGIDYIPKAIEYARSRTVAKKSRIKFSIGNFDSLQFPANSFDAVIAIDTLYMPNNLESTINQILKILKKHGKLLTFYLQFFDKTYDVLEYPKQTALALALENLNIPYQYWDFTRQNYEHMRKKHYIANDLKELFIKEGNQFLLDNIVAQSIADDRPYNERSCRIRRYLYVIQKE